MVKIFVQRFFVQKLDLDQKKKKKFSGSILTVFFLNFYGLNIHNSPSDIDNISKKNETKKKLCAQRWPGEYCENLTYPKLSHGEFRTFINRIDRWFKTQKKCVLSKFVVGLSFMRGVRILKFLGSQIRNTNSTVCLIFDPYHPRLHYSKIWYF